MTSTDKTSMANLSMTNKVALVTGGSSGIGRATAQALATRGAAVVIADFNVESGEQSAADIAARGGTARFMTLDVADPEAVAAVFAAVEAEFGRLDMLVNCAGISTLQAPVGDYPVAEWQRAININLNGSFYCMHHAIALMLKSGGGAIVNISSIMGSVANAGGSAYAASKHGVIGLTKAAAQDYGAQGIRVNAVGPGVIKTPMTKVVTTDPNVTAMMMQRTPIGRFGEPEEVASLIAFLCSDEAGFITGAYYPIDGGYLTN